MALLPSDPLAIVSLGLIAATIAILIFSDWPRAYLLGVSAIVLFGIQFADQAFLGARLGLFELSLSTARLEQGEWWTPVTYAFVHGSLFHLFGNLFILLTAGPALEDSVGPRKFLVIYAIGALAAAAAGLVLSRTTDIISPFTPMVGSSGAIFAVLTAYAVRHPREKLPIPFWIILWLPSMVVLLIFLAMNIGYIFIDTNVAWYGHFAGFLAGLVLAGEVDGDQQGAETGKLDVDALAPLATTPRGEEAIEHLDTLHEGEADVAAVWLDVLAEESECPVCGRGLQRRRLAVVCPQGHDLASAMEEHDGDTAGTTTQPDR